MKMESCTPGGDFYIKVTGVIVLPLRVFKSKMATIKVIPLPFTISSQKNNVIGTGLSVELVRHRGENELAPRPQNEILVPFRGSFVRLFVCRRSRKFVIYR